MDTFIWGPSLWKMLHSVSFADPGVLRAHKQHLLDFMDSLGDTLPCVYCRDSYKTFLTQLPDLGDTIDTGELSGWMYSLHSMVNSKLGVKDPTFERVKKRYTIRPMQWCVGDLWETIALFGINYTPQKSEAYRMWWEGLIVIVSISADGSLDTLLRSVECPCTTGTFVSTSMVLSRAYNNLPSPSEEHVVATTTLYALAIAGRCAGGTCE